MVFDEKNSPGTRCITTSAIRSICSIHFAQNRPLCVVHAHACTDAQELSEAELWALDDKQRDEHFRMEERRRRAEFDRAKRTVERVELLPTVATAGVPATEVAMATPTATPASPSSKVAEGAANG